MDNKFVVSPSPHARTQDTTPRIMYGVSLSLLPALGVAVWFFGLAALKVTLVSVASCLLCELLIQRFLIKGPLTIKDGSALITGLLLAFNLPSSIPCWMIAVGAAVAIGVGKMSFGGLGTNPFNPALVGRVFMLISFPTAMTTWPVNRFAGALADGATGATPLAAAKEALKAGQPVSEISAQFFDTLNTFVGNMGGSLGEVSALALLLGGIYMLVRGIITWHIPVAIFATVFAFSGILHLAAPESFMPPLFHLLTGGMVLGAVYMATDMVTTPMTKRGMVVFGVGVGLITVVIRTWGAYPEGMSFAILIMNALVPLINRYCKPQRFGKEAAHGKA